MSVVKMNVPQRKFLGMCNNISDYADAAAGGDEVFGFIGGQFSLIDALSACVKIVDKPLLTLSTWTAAKSDMDHVFQFLDSGVISGCRWVVDRSFPNRQPDLCERLRGRFGDDTIRVMRVHCKFALLGDENGGLVIQTSANLNRNMRIENLSISPCPVFYRAYYDLVKQMFGLQMPAEGFEDSSSATRAHKQLAFGGETWVDQKLRRKKAAFERKLKKLGG